MQSKFRRTGALACAGADVFGALAVAAGTQADAQQTPLDQLIGQPTPGLAALDEVQSRLAEIAQSNGLSEQKLRDVLATDKTSWLDSDGRLFFREPGLTTPQKAPEVSPRWATEAVADAEGPAFELHSKPGSNRVIYLDTATASPAALGGNLDMKLELLDSAGAVVASADPASGQSNAGTPTGLGASVASNLQAGTCYLRIDNAGYSDPLNTGCSTYGSRGAHALAINPS
ncbi:hypothetical protein ACFPJ1_05875 [Kribbella qitaiheensis]|uniref:hypothetical protein n=1 Tax=Kribbella qitaiheensis TaxID=1544730 RepID=UPI0036112CF0